jgi:hypothetical protein
VPTEYTAWIGIDGLFPVEKRGRPLVTEFHQLVQKVPVAVDFRRAVEPLAHPDPVNLGVGELRFGEEAVVDPVGDALDEVEFLIQWDFPRVRCAGR